MGEKIKISIEIESDVYEQLKKQYEEFKGTIGIQLNIHTVEDYIKTIITSYAQGGEHIKKLSTSFRDALEKIGSMNLEDIDLGSVDINKIFESATFKKKDKTEETKKTDDKSSNLKS